MLRTRIRRILSKTWVKAMLIAVGSIALLGLGVAGTFVVLFIPRVPAASFPPPTNQVEAYKQDLDQLRAYAQYEKAFDEPRKREAFESRVAEIGRGLSGMTPARFELAVAGAVALGHNGHTNVSPIGRTRRVNHFPVRTGPFEDGEFIL